MTRVESIRAAPPGASRLPLHVSNSQMIWMTRRTQAIPVIQRSIVIGPRFARTRWLAPPAITAKPLRRDDGLEITVHDLAARCARVLQEPFAQENRGRGECRVPNAPTASRAKFK